MGGHYAYSPSIWPMLATAAFSLTLAGYGWRRRSVPGALPFTLLMADVAGWAVGAALQIAAIDFAAQALGLKLEMVCQLGAATLAFWFALEYTDIARHLSTPTLALLALPSVFSFAAIATGVEEALGLGAVLDAGGARVKLGTIGELFRVYGLVLAAAGSVAFVWLFVTSPLHRWPAAVCLVGHVASRGGYLLDAAGANPLAPLDATVLGWNVTATMYAVALFKFNMFAVVPIARHTVIDQMSEGMVVIDVRQRVVDLNPTAETILGVSAHHARGRRLYDLLPVSNRGDGTSDLSGRGGGAPALQPQIVFGDGARARHYALDVSPLQHHRGTVLGHLVLLHDVTDTRRAQARALQQERLVATLRERDRVARELHDDLGQVLGFVKMQAQASRLGLARGEPAAAERYLTQILAVVQEAHVDVREFIHDASTPRGSLTGALEHLIQKFSERSGIAATLDVPASLHDPELDPMAAAQLLRIVQESLANVRKHARARLVRVALMRNDGYLEASICDDGDGFDPATTAARGRFGIHFMRERAEEVGGRLSVRSAPGQGTTVSVSVPFGKERL